MLIVRIRCSGVLCQCPQGPEEEALVQMAASIHGKIIKQEAPFYCLEAKGTQGGVETSTLGPCTDLNMSFEGFTRSLQAQ